MSLQGKTVEIGTIPAVLTELKLCKMYRIFFEYLGVIMDDKLCMDGHINHVIKKVQGKLCILRKFRRHITERTALRIYECVILILLIL